MLSSFASGRTACFSGPGTVEKITSPALSLIHILVPVKAEYKGSVPGIVHEKSASGATLFVEPACVVESNNRIRELEGEEAREVSRILAELTSMLYPYQKELRKDIEILTELDVLFAKAALGLEMKAVPVTFTEKGTLELSEGRHPLIDPKKVVPVSLHMKNGCLLYTSRCV